MKSRLAERAFALLLAEREAYRLYGSDHKTLLEVVAFLRGDS